MVASSGLSRHSLRVLETSSEREATGYECLEHSVLLGRPPEAITALGPPSCPGVEASPRTRLEVANGSGLRLFAHHKCSALHVFHADVYVQNYGN